MTRRAAALAALLLFSVAPAARADLLADPRYAEGATFRMQQFIRRGVDPAEAEAIFRKLSTLDAEPWVAEWTRLAEPWEVKARALEAEGKTVEAREAYLKAATRYSIAKFPVINHPAKQAAYRKEVELYLKAAKYFDVPLERVTIPFEGKAIIGYLRKPPGVAKPPIVIVTGGVDVYKEDRDVSDMLGAGLAAFSMDMPGAGECPVWYTAGAERLYTATIDYLQTRGDIDGSRIGMLGRSYGGYWGGKMAYVEPVRIKAAVMWGGPIHYTFQDAWLQQAERDRKYLWSLLDSMIYANHVKDLDELRRQAPSLSLLTQGWLDKPSAPLLALNGEKDPWISPNDVLILAEHGPSAKAIRLYPEGTHMGDNPGSTPMVARWLKEQLAR
jgi:esterase FrsA